MSEEGYVATFKVRIDNSVFGLNEEPSMTPLQMFKYLVKEEGLFGLFDADEFKLISLTNKE